MKTMGNLTRLDKAGRLINVYNMEIPFTKITKCICNNYPRYLQQMWGLPKTRSPSGLFDMLKKKKKEK